MRPVRLACKGKDSKAAAQCKQRRLHLRDGPHERRIRLGLACRAEYQLDRGGRRERYPDWAKRTQAWRNHRDLPEHRRRPKLEPGRIFSTNRLVLYYRNRMVRRRYCAKGGSEGGEGILRRRVQASANHE